jgi:hypothetical protein
MALLIFVQPIVDGAGAARADPAAPPPLPGKQNGHEEDYNNPDDGADWSTLHGERLPLWSL